MPRREKKERKRRAIERERQERVTADRSALVEDFRGRLRAEVGDGPALARTIAAIKRSDVTLWEATAGLADDGQGRPGTLIHYLRAAFVANRHDLVKLKALLELVNRTGERVWNLIAMDLSLTPDELGLIKDVINPHLAEGKPTVVLKRPQLLNRPRREVPDEQLWRPERPGEKA